jgi:Domain of unknown function (DUF4388)
MQRVWRRGWDADEEAQTTWPGADPGRAQVLVKGEIVPGLLEELLELFSLNHETGTLHVQGPTVSGAIHLVAGEVGDAELGSTRGEAAKFRVLALATGRFVYERGARHVRTKHKIKG